MSKKQHVTLTGPLKVGPNSTALTHIGRAEGRSIADALALVARRVEAEFGVKFKLNRSVYDDSSVKITVEFSIEREDGVAMTHDAQMFLNRCNEFGLHPDHLGREFEHDDGRRFKIVGLRPRAPKRPVMCNVLDGSDRVFVFPAHAVCKYLGVWGQPRRSKPNLKVVG